MSVVFSALVFTCICHMLLIKSCVLLFCGVNSWISHHMTLEPGDVVLTGTPPGVGPVRAGDHIDCGITNLIQMAFDVDS